MLTINFLFILRKSVILFSNRNQQLVLVNHHHGFNWY